MKVFLGVDCGATHLRVGLVDSNGNIAASETRGSPLAYEPLTFAEKVHQIAINLLEKEGFLTEDIKGVGVGVPGPLNLEKGEILTSSNLNNDQPIRIKDMLEAKGYRNIYIDRDTVAALLGESWRGAARDLKDVLMLTLGSGVGGAIMVDGKVVKGKNGQAGEVGHIILDTHQGSPELPVCGLGHKGCLEGFIRWAKDLDQLGFYLGLALANLVDIFNPEKIIISGGMVKRGNFLPKAVQVMKEAGIKPLVSEVEVEFSTLGDLAGVVGAVKLVLDKNSD